MSWQKYVASTCVWETITFHCITYFAVNGQLTILIDRSKLRDRDSNWVMNVFCDVEDCVKVNFALLCILTVSSNYCAYLKQRNVRGESGGGGIIVSKWKFFCMCEYVYWTCIFYNIITDQLLYCTALNPNPTPKWGHFDTGRGKCGRYAATICPDCN